MADALFTSTQQRVLALLFGQPQRSFFTQQLIELAGAGRGAVQRELERLQQSGLIVRTAQGNQKHYQANPGSPVFGELCVITTKLLGPADTLREALSALAHKIQLALLYGSAASHRDTAHSDFDVLLVSDELTLEKVYEALTPAEKKLGRPINPTLYTHAEFHKRLEQRNPFLIKLVAGETISLIGDKDDFIATG
jgi:predicted nucleotidyltransferase